MTLQIIVVALIVSACMTYAVWTLMPAASRRWLAMRVLDLPLPNRVAATMRKHATASSGCACDGCDQGAAKKAPSAVQTIRFRRRPPR